MSDGHHCTRWLERRLRCPFDGAGWHQVSFDPDQIIKPDLERVLEEEEEKRFKIPNGIKVPSEEEDEKSGSSDRGRDFDWDNWLDYTPRDVTSIAFTKMGYMVYGEILWEAQKELIKTTSVESLNVAPFTSTGAYLQMVEASEVAVATSVARGSSRPGLGGQGTSFTQPLGLSLSDAASIIIWATSIATAFGMTRARSTPAGFAAVLTARVMPPEIMAFIANLGKNSPGIWGETAALGGLAMAWLFGNREMAPLPEEYRRTVYNQNAWADPGLG